MTTYVYDRRIGKVVEKRSRDNIEIVPSSPPPFWREHREFMDGVQRILDETAITLTVKGDCGGVHPTFEHWQKCPVCESILRQRLPHALGQTP